MVRADDAGGPSTQRGENIHSSFCCRTFTGDVHKKGATYNFNPPSPVPIEHRPYSNLAPGNSQLYWVADECRQRKNYPLACPGALSGQNS